jgi:hypothetical protein
MITISAHNKQGEPREMWLLVLFGLLQLADAWTTLLPGPGQYEANPVMNWLFALASPFVVIVLVKSCLIVSATLFYNYSRHEWALRQVGCRVLLMSLDAAYFAVVARNFLYS